MRLLLDFFPIALFVLAYKTHDVYVATAVLMGATVLQMCVIYALERKLQTMHRITLVLVLVFGALTLGLHDERFIKWKPTVLYGAMAAGLAVAQWGFKRNVLHLLLGKQLSLPPGVWMRLTLAWVLYFVFMAALNAYVAVAFSTDQWVNFKLWGYVFPVAFLLGQGIYIAPHLKNDSES